MITVMLYGFLGKKFGKVHRYHVKSASEAIKALSATLPGFKQALIEGGSFKILRAGKEPLSLEDINNPQSSKETIRIIPIVEGAGGDGLLNVVAGVALVWATGGLASFGLSGMGIFTGASSGAMVGGAMAATGAAGALAGISGLVAGIGMSLIMSGVSQMLFSPPSVQQGNYEPANNRPSYSFNGAVNTSAQGNPVPICYGRLIVGSQVISAGLTVEQQA